MDSQVIIGIITIMVSLLVFNFGIIKFLYNIIAKRIDKLEQEIKNIKKGGDDL